VSGLVADAFHRNRSPQPNSLITGNLTGNFLILGPFGRFSLLIGEQIQMVTIEFPTRRNREFFSAEQGMFLREQGISAEQQGSGIGDQFQKRAQASWCGRETASRRVMVLNEGFAWNGATYRSLTAIAFATVRHPLVGRSTEQAVSARAPASDAGATTRPARRTSGRRRSRVAVDLRRRP
jgi:hypothetical protein